MTRSALVTLLSIALGAGGLRLAAQGQGSSDRPRFGTSTAAVVVDVIVRDKRGQPVVDLTRDDFEVSENGTPQRLIDFERVLPGASSPIVATNPSAGMAEPAGHNAEVGGRLKGQSVTAIVFDWLSDENRYRAWEAASTLLDQMAADDYVAVYVINNSLQRVVPYTRDTRGLKMAFDYAVKRPRQSPSRTEGALIAALGQQNDAPLTPNAESASGGLQPGIPVSTDRAAAAAAAMIREMQLFEQYMDRNVQGITVSRSLRALAEQLGGMPGRKTVVLFSEGLQITDRAKHSFDMSEEIANRNNISIYTVDAAGLRVHSEQRITAQQIPEAGGAFSTGISNDPTGRAAELMWRDPTLGLKPLAERTGGLYIGDTNDLKGGFARINADRRFHYLLAYSSSNPALDGSYRKIDVRVRRAGVKVRARSGYVASPSIEQVTRREYEAPALAALTIKPTPAAFAFQPTAISTPMHGEPGMTTLVAAVGTDVVTFREDPSRRTYDGELTVLARVVSKAGDALATQSQLYQLRGDLQKLPQARQGRLLFFKTPDVPPGAHTVEWVVRDGASGSASVLKSPIVVPPPDVRPVVGDLVVIDRAEAAPKDDPTTKRHPLVWKDLLLYPSLGLPISKAARADLTFFLPMLVDRSVPPPATTIELIAGGRSLGAIDVPASRPEDDSLQLVGTLPVDRLPPGVYELKATVRAGDRVVSRTAAFTLVP